MQWCYHFFLLVMNSWTSNFCCSFKAYRFRPSPRRWFHIISHGSLVLASQQVHMGVQSWWQLRNHWRHREWALGTGYGDSYLLEIRCCRICAGRQVAGSFLFLNFSTICKFGESMWFYELRKYPFIVHFRGRKSVERGITGLIIVCILCNKISFHLDTSHYPIWMKRAWCFP